MTVFDRGLRVLASRTGAVTAENKTLAAATSGTLIGVGIILAAASVWYQADARRR